MNATNWEDALYRHYLPRCRTCVELIAESVVDCALGVLFQKRKEDRNCDRHILYSSKMGTAMLPNSAPVPYQLVRYSGGEEAGLD